MSSEKEDRRLKQLAKLLEAGQRRAIRDVFERLPRIILDSIDTVWEEGACPIHCAYCCPSHDGQATAESCQDQRCVDMRRDKAGGGKNWLGHVSMGQVGGQTQDAEKPA